MLQLTDSSLLKTQNFVNGHWIPGSAGTLNVNNPANGDLLVAIANGDAKDATNAVEAAAAACKPINRLLE